MKRALLATICAALALTGMASPARAAFDDPLFFFIPQPPPPPPPIPSPPPAPPPASFFDGPCGLTVDAAGNFYVSDYYHRAVDVFSGGAQYLKQPLTAWTGAANPHTGPVDDPCGLALSSSGTLYVNNYHRNVVRFPAPLSLATATVIDSGDPTNLYANPTGVAVNPATDHVYVDDRTYVAEYDSSGAFVRKIGEGTLQDGYGIAVSGYPGTSGYLYVPDAATDTVKIYDPSFSTATPKATITGPLAGFGSLKDAATSVDNATGEVYVADTRGPQLTEEPEASVYVFAADRTYEGRLKHNTIDAAPVGLAVDNSGGETQGRVYLTSGITENAGIYAYPPHAATIVAEPPLAFSGSTEEEHGTAESSAFWAVAGTTSTSSASSLRSDSSSSSLQAKTLNAARRRLRRRHRALHAGRHARRIPAKASLMGPP